jgi:hypothetical protein
LLLAALLALIGLFFAGATITLSGGTSPAYGQYQYGPVLAGPGEISGLVVDESGNGIGGAYVSACRSSAEGGGCRTVVTSTDATGGGMETTGGGMETTGGGTDTASGAYAVSNLPDGDYTVTAYPPSGSSALPAKIGPLTLSASGEQNLADQDIVLALPKPLPEDTTITSLYETQDGIPVVLPSEPLTLTTQGCAGGTASYQVLRDGQVIRSGGMTEGPPGTYTANVEPLGYGGPARFEIAVDCPEGPDETVAFDVYIDPSGYVRTVSGDPIEGAKVTLLRFDPATGQFEAVPDGSAIMSPSNQTNPDATDSDGHFGWDVIPGVYKVRAEKEGCASPKDPEQGFVESRVIPIPPPVFDLDLRLDCGVRYDFSGFFAPVDNPDTLNKAKAGSAIPVNFSLSGDEGLDVFAEGYPKSERVDCDSDAPVDGIEQTVTAGGSSLSYDATADRYTYVWKTDKAWSNADSGGPCRQLVVKLKDGSIHRADFEFTK